MTAASKQTFEGALERVRRSFGIYVYGYVAMPEHVHLLISEARAGTVADAVKSLKQGISRRLIGEPEHFWQKRYPVKRRLCERPEEWRGAGSCSMQPGAKDE
jgi:putative transposase